MTGPVTAVSGGVRITLHVQPRASSTAVQGLHGDAIKLRIAAPPVDGAANDEVIRFMAERLGVAQRAVILRQGTTGRRKVIEVTGVTPEWVRERLGA